MAGVKDPYSKVLAMDHLNNIIALCSDVISS